MTLHIDRDPSTAKPIVNAEIAFMKMSSRIAAVLLLALSTGLASAQDDAEQSSPFRNGSYISVMGTGVFVDDDSDLDDSIGGTLGFGFRKDWWAMEIAPSYVDLKDAKLATLAINGLLFPLKSLPNFYLTAGVSGSQWKNYQTPTDEIDFGTVNGDGGLGYLFPLKFGSYEFGIRAEGRYRAYRRERDYNDADRDFDAPKHFRHAIASVGLHFPLGIAAPPPPAAAAPEPVQVVPAVSPCSDGQDNDGDALVDFPADPGCTAADDVDETDPPQCADGKDNDGDGQIDFPNDKGCAAADDNDETDPCKAPHPGERISLRGCGTGDVIVLRGVNFEYDKSRLTKNAKTILDNVADELVAYPEIKVELGGHTDARGSEEYNQRLSEKRAEAVKQFLIGKGVAAERMTSVGFGETKPVADNETDEGRELNRRTELRITEGAAAPAAAAPPAATPAASETPPAADAPAASDGAAGAEPAATP